MGYIRIKGNELYYHVILRCNNGERLLSDPPDCQRALEFLKKYSDVHTCEIHNYTVMPSHIHLMLMTNYDNYIDVVMHDYCLAVARDYNRRHNRSGHFWRHPYRSKIIGDDRYALACLRYIHRNAPSAGLVNKIEDWVWSAYHYYACGTPNEVITPHPSYFLLGSTEELRRMAYRQFVNLNSDIKEESLFFEGIRHEGSRRYNHLQRQIYDSIMKFLTTTTNQLRSGKK